MIIEFTWFFEQFLLYLHKYSLHLEAQKMVYKVSEVWFYFIWEKLCVGWYVNLVNLFECRKWMNISFYVFEQFFVYIYELTLVDETHA